MSAFEDMQQLFSTWADQSLNYQVRSADFARQFALGFAKYIGAPDHYLAMDRVNNMAYVEPLKLVTRHNGTEELVLPEHGLDLIKRDEDGWHLFGVRYTLDRASNAFPKQPFGFAVRFQLKEDTCTVQVAGGEFNVDPRDQSALAPAYDQMIRKLREALSRNPWDRPTKEPIGFMPPSTD